ncbi:MAG: HigA family addiction module antitoxin [bacterium]
MSMKDRKRCPGHPGRILRNLYLKPLSIPNTKLAEILGVSRKTISSIVNERKSVTPDMALRLSQAFPNSTAESWLNLQKNYDLWQTAHNTHDWKSVRAISSVQTDPSQNIVF